MYHMGDTAKPWVLDELAGESIGPRLEKIKIDNGWG